MARRGRLNSRSPAMRIGAHRHAARAHRPARREHAELAGPADPAGGARGADGTRIVASASAPATTTVRACNRLWTVLPLSRGLTAAAIARSHRGNRRFDSLDAVRGQSFPAGVRNLPEGRRLTVPAHELAARPGDRGAGGIGRALVRAFTAEGARVHIADTVADGVAAVAAGATRSPAASATSAIQDSSRRCLRMSRKRSAASMCSSTTPARSARPRRPTSSTSTTGAACSRST